LLAGVRAGNIELELLDMAGIVAEVRQRLQYLIGEEQVEIIEPDKWPPALGYGPWVEEIWMNYIGNAIKYGGQPPRVELGAELQTNRSVRFWVQDNGVGLPAEAQPDLFKPFIRPSQIRIEGHGLGLSIVRHIVEKLGGEVGVESEGIPGQGSRFSFTLPLVDEGSKAD
jgi:signal transduction histidine kinase